MGKQPSVLVILSAAFAISACAKDPEKIAAVHMEDSAYAGYSCRQLEQEELRQWQTLRTLYASQESAQGGDALGVFLLGLPLSSMAGGDKETEIAVTKGRLDALDRQQIGKRCPATSVDAEKTALAAAAAAKKEK